MSTIVESLPGLWREKQFTVYVDWKNNEMAAVFEGDELAPIEFKVDEIRLPNGDTEFDAAFFESHFQNVFEKLTPDMVSVADDYDPKRYQVDTYLTVGRLREPITYRFVYEGYAL